MFLILCPHCNEKRPEIEFRYAHEAHITRPENPSALSDAEWADYLFMRKNTRGLHFERWVHVHGCARFFNAIRDTVTDEFVMTYAIDAPRPSDAEIEESMK